MVLSGMRAWRVKANALPTRLACIALGGAIVIAGHGLVSWAPATSTLLADGSSGGPGADSDSDGLPDKVEAQFGSNQAASSDLDQDGFPDLVEVLLNTEPANRSSFPTPLQAQTPEARILGFLEGDQFHVQVSVYVPVGGPSVVSGVGGMLVVPEFFGGGNGAFLDLNPLIYEGAVTYQAYPNGSGVVSSDSWLPAAYLPLLSAQGSGHTQFTVAFAATVGGVSINDIELFLSTNGKDPNSLASLQITAGTGGGAFRPLEPVAPPPEWQSDAACVLTYTVVGVEPGAVLVIEATSGSCQPFAGTACDGATCAAQVGQVFKTLDPTSLGG